MNNVNTPWVVLCIVNIILFTIIFILSLRLKYTKYENKIIRYLFVISFFSIFLNAYIGARNIQLYNEEKFYK